MGTKQALVLGVCLIVAAIGHSVASTLLAGRSPLAVREGYATSSLHVQEIEGISELKCKGCKVECFDRFVVVYVDRAREPTWTGNYILVIPWDKIKSPHLTLLPHPPQG